MCNAKTFAAPKKFSRAPSRVQRTGPSSSKPRARRPRRSPLGYRKKALETPEEQKRPDDRRVIFPWQDDPAYCDAQPQTLTEETVRYFEDKPGFSHNQKSWYQRARAQCGRPIKGEFPTVLEERFQTPVEGVIYAEIIDRLRAEGAIRPAVVDNSSLVHTAWDLGSPLNTVVTYFQIVGAEIRVIDCASDLDLV